MREILFRGKSVDSKQWEYGQLIKGRYYLDLKPVVALMSPQLIFYPRCEVNGWAEVFPETVGQFTGLTDKNGKKIFEGDIVWHHIEEEDAVIQFYEGGFIVNFFKSGAIDELRENSRYLEVTSNIHDNPELLKED